MKVCNCMSSLKCMALLQLRRIPSQVICKNRRYRCCVHVQRGCCRCNDTRKATILVYGEHAYTKHDNNSNTDLLMHKELSACLLHSIEVIVQQQDEAWVNHVGLIQHLAYT